jgi:hypothetical protein
MRLIAAALALACLWAPAKAHDIYHGLREGHRPTGPLCCGGDPITGDCESFKPDEFAQTRRGDLIFMSRRYGVMVRVPAERVVDLPVPNTEGFTAHWCGKPLGDKNDPMTEWRTFCAFVDGGGS